MSGPARRELLAFNRRMWAAINAGDETRKWAEVVQYVRSAPPSLVRDNLLLSLSFRAKENEDRDVEIEWLTFLVEKSERPGYRQMARYMLMDALLGAGRREEARAMVEAIPQAGVGGIRERDQVSAAFERSKYLVALGDVAAARQSFLSQTPAPGAREARREYLNHAARLAVQLSISAEPAVALDFRRTLLERYPELATPDFLKETLLSAELAKEPVVRRAVFDSLVKQYPHSGAAAYARYTYARDALSEADFGTARPHLRAIVDAPRARRDLREWAAAALRSGGVPAAAGPAGGPSLLPVPDPAFTPPTDGAADDGAAEEKRDAVPNYTPD